MAGLAAYGDHDNALGVAVGDGKVTVWRREKGNQQTLASRDAPQPLATRRAPRAPHIYLRMTATGGDRFRFAVSRDGLRWTTIGEQLNGEREPGQQGPAKAAALQTLNSKGSTFLKWESSPIQTS